MITTTNTNSTNGATEEVKPITFDVDAQYITEGPFTIFLGEVYINELEEVQDVVDFCETLESAEGYTVDDWSNGNEYTLEDWVRLNK